MLMLSPFANADMDNVCRIFLIYDKDLTFTDITMRNMVKMIESKGCERNNILLLTLPSGPNITLDLQRASALWCRHDRNESVVADTLKCVLYDTKPRKLLF